MHMPYAQVMDLAHQENGRQYSTRFAGKSKRFIRLRSETGCLETSLPVSRPVLCLHSQTRLHARSGSLASIVVRTHSDCADDLRTALGAAFAATARKSGET